MLTNGEGEGFDDPAFKPKRKNGRSKGKKGEREVAKLCAGWWTLLEPGCEFRSTPSSGGWATPQLRGHFKVAGDLTTTAKRWPFTVEVKRREAWVLARLYLAKPSPVWGWWKQACKAAQEEGRAPILFLRHNSPGGGHAPEWFVLLPDWLSELVPRLDNWSQMDAILAGMVSPMLTTWEALARVAPKAIIRACRAHASPPALAASPTLPKLMPSQPLPKPRKARQRPAQADASSPLGQYPNTAGGLTVQLQAIGVHLATPRRPRIAASSSTKPPKRRANASGPASSD